MFECGIARISDSGQSKKVFLNTLFTQELEPFKNNPENKTNFLAFPELSQIIFAQAKISLLNA